MERLPSIEKGHEAAGKQTEPSSCILPMRLVRVATLVLSIVRCLVLLNVLQALGGSLDAAPISLRSDDSVIAWTESSK